MSDLNLMEAGALVIDAINTASYTPQIIARIKDKLASKQKPHNILAGGYEKAAQSPAAYTIVNSLLKGLPLEQMSEEAFRLFSTNQYD